MKVRRDAVCAVCACLLAGEVSESVHHQPHRHQPSIVTTMPVSLHLREHTEQQENPFVSLRLRKAVSSTSADTRFWSDDDSPPSWPSDDSLKFWRT